MPVLVLSVEGRIPPLLVVSVEIYVSGLLAKEFAPWMTLEAAEIVPVVDDGGIDFAGSKAGSNSVANSYCQNVALHPSGEISNRATR